MTARLILYNPWSNAAGKKILPMSLLALAAVLEHKYQFTIVDGNCEPDPLSTIRNLLDDGVRVLAVTVMPGPQLSVAVPHCRALKKAYPDLTVIWGGYFPTQHAATCLEPGAVDFVVRGHGEQVLADLLAALTQDTDPRAISGLVFRGEHGVIVQNPAALVPHPDSLPDYPYDSIDVAQYVRSTFLGSRTLPYHSSYGCPFSCSFCAVPDMAGHRWLPQGAGRVADAVRTYVERWGANAVEFYDNNFFAAEARTAEFAGRILPLQIAWWGEGRIDTLLRYPDRTWRLLRSAGLKMVFMGAEAGSQEALRRMDKGGTLTPDQTLEIAARMKAHGIVPEFSFIVGSPPDPEGDAHRTIAFIRRLKQVNPLSEIILYRYTPEPVGGDLLESAHAAGFRFPATLDEWVSRPWLEFAQRRGSQLPWLSVRLSRHVRNFERVLNAYYPTSTDARLGAPRRALLRAASAWRYHAGIYAFPFELRALEKLVPYRRPETSGF